MKDRGTYSVLAPELISSLIWTTEAYVPATIVKVPMRTKITLTTVRIHQLRVLSLRHVTCRYMRASVILGCQPMTSLYLGYLHAEERTKKGTNDGEEIIEDWDGFGNDERHQAIESDTTANRVSKARMTSIDHLQPNSIVDRGVSSQMTGPTQNPDEDWQCQL